jgi:hypothetical protein
MVRDADGKPVGKEEIDTRLTASLASDVVDLNARIRTIVEGTAGSGLAPNPALMPGVVTIALHVSAPAWKAPQRFGFIGLVGRQRPHHVIPTATSAPFLPQQPTN